MSNKKKAIIFVVSGPSGSGKTTLIKKILQKKIFGGNLIRPVSFTTRPRRDAEIDKKDYFFITKKKFFEKIRNKEFLETTKYLDFYYATSRKVIKNILRKKKDAILCLDTKGAKSIRKIFPQNSVCIFILPPSKDTLKERLHIRASEHHEQIKKRLDVAEKELKISKWYDYRIINHSLKEAVECLKKIILKEKRHC